MFSKNIKLLVFLFSFNYALATKSARLFNNTRHPIVFSCEANEFIHQITLPVGMSTTLPVLKTIKFWPEGHEHANLIIKNEEVSDNSLIEILQCIDCRLILSDEEHKTESESTKTVCVKNRTGDEVKYFTAVLRSDGSKNITEVETIVNGTNKTIKFDELLILIPKIDNQKEIVIHASLIPQNSTICMGNSLTYGITSLNKIKPLFEFSKKLNSNKKFIYTFK